MLLLTGRGIEVHCVTGMVVHCCRVLEVQVGRLTGRHTFRGTEVHRGTGITWEFFVIMNENICGNGSHDCLPYIISKYSL